MDLEDYSNHDLDFSEFDFTLGLDFTNNNNNNVSTLISTSDVIRVVEEGEEEVEEKIPGLDFDWDDIFVEPPVTLKRTLSIENTPSLYVDSIEPRSLNLNEQTWAPTIHVGSIEYFTHLIQNLLGFIQTPVLSKSILKKTKRSHYTDIKEWYQTYFLNGMCKDITPTKGKKKIVKEVLMEFLDLSICANAQPPIIYEFCLNVVDPTQYEVFVKSFGRPTDIWRFQTDGCQFISVVVSKTVDGIMVVGHYSC